MVTNSTARPRPHVDRRPRRRSPRAPQMAVRYVVLSAAALVFILPVFWMVNVAVKPPAEVAEDPFALPRELALTNLLRAWDTGNYSQYLLNTLFYCVTIVVAVCILSCLGGYAFGVLRFRSHRALFALFLLGVIVPFQAVMIPEYYLLRDLRLLGSVWGYVLPGTAFGLGFAMFLMRAFFRSLPYELVEAARLDGASEFRVFTRVMLPLAMPGLSTLAIFQFMYTWKNFLIPLVLVQRDSLRPMSLGITFFYGRYSVDLGMVAAAITIMSVPMIILYVVLQRQITHALIQGALKG